MVHYVLDDLDHIELVGNDVLKKHVIFPKGVSTRHYGVGAFDHRAVRCSRTERFDDVKVNFVVFSQLVLNFDDPLFLKLCPIAVP